MWYINIKNNSSRFTILNTHHKPFFPYITRLIKSLKVLLSIWSLILTFPNGYREAIFFRAIRISFIMFRVIDLPPPPPPASLDLFWHLTRTGHVSGGGGGGGGSDGGGRTWTRAWLPPTCLPISKLLRIIVFLLFRLSYVSQQLVTSFSFHPTNVFLCI